MTERVKRAVIEHKAALMSILFILLLLILGIAFSREEQTQDVKALRNQLDISRANANALQKRLTEVQAAREKSDRTVVTPITKDADGKELPQDNQKVDVYKINLRKDHRIKAGASVIDGKPLMSIGYEQGRFEALAHFDGARYKGVTVTYNIIEW